MRTKEIEVVLKYYRALCVFMENQKELDAAGIDSVFPCLVDNKVKEMKVHAYKAITKVINELGDIERLIIQKKYLGRDQITDETIYKDIGLSKGKYYQIKKKALKKIAEALNNIQLTVIN